MGFFSGECKSCGLSIISKYALTEQLQNLGGEKLTKVVYQTDGMQIIGTYGGYGDITTDTGIEVDELYWESCQAYHYHCWVDEGRPAFDKDSPMSNFASDQGFFLDDERYENHLQERD